jgi:hypothetical protein
MRREVLELDVELTAAVGDAQLCEILVDKWVQIGGTFTATVEIQITINGTDWVTLGSYTAGDILEIPQNAQYIRVETTAYTTGTPTVTLAGRSARTD